MTATDSRPGVPGRRSGDQVPGGSPAVAAAPRRRVTEIPRETEQWFRDHSPDAGRARELARAELTAERDGYVFRWVRPWACQLCEPDDQENEIATAHDIMLDGTPGTDPRARKVERQLLRTAGRDDPHGPGAVITWEQTWTCQLLEPDGTTVIDESGGWARDPAASPGHARLIAARLALEAGI